MIDIKRALRIGSKINNTTGSNLLGVNNGKLFEATSATDPTFASITAIGTGTFENITATGLGTFGNITTTGTEHLIT